MDDVFVDDETWDGENVPTVYLDWLGQEVRVGDTVIYAITKGRSAALVMGQVLEFRIADSRGELMQHHRTEYDYNFRPPKLKHTTVTHKWNFKIRPMKDSLSSYWKRERDKEGEIRAQVIGTIHNITKVDARFADEVDA